MDERNVLSVKDITKSFGNNKVLDGVSFQVKEGEIHALMGENGAGKSTILNIMSGSLKMTSGELFLYDKPVNFTTPLAARKAGIVKVHQELQVIPELTVAENIFIGNEIKHSGSKFLWYSKMRQEADRILEKLDADFDSSRIVKTLSAAQKQLVEISKAMLYDFSLMILDEPTSSLTNREIKRLFSIVKKLKEEGKSFIFVSHRMPEIFELADRITVLKDGKCMGTYDIEEVDNKRLVQLMTGRELGNQVKNERTTCTDEVVLRVENLCGKKNKFSDVSFDLHRGEIIGFAGLVGSGRTEIMRAIFGADPKESGDVYVRGKKVEHLTTSGSVKNKIALVPEERKTQGMVGILPNYENICLGSMRAIGRGGPLTAKKLRAAGKTYMEMLKVQPNMPELPTGRLSGGNQQKIVIGKWLCTEADIIIMDEPTRGIDVGAKHEIYKLMLQLVREGKSIIMISSELPEIINLSDRIMVMHEGKLQKVLDVEGVTEEMILHYAMGGE